MNRKIKKIWFNIVGLLLFLVMMISISSLVSGVVISDTVTLNPLGEEVIPLKMHENDEALLAVDMTSGEIYIELYESAAYPSFDYYEDYWGPVTSTFSTWLEPTWSDTYYIRFYNADNSNGASFTYTIDHDQSFLINNVIINLAIAGTLLGAILVLNFTGKKNPQASS